MANTVQTYLDLVTSEYAEQPNFNAMISFMAAVAVQIQNCMLSMIPLFDVDVAVGNQLDIIGQWAGITRNVSIPITGVYFSWNESFSVGWDYGSWQPYNQPTSITVLPDDAYRTLIKAKIAANNWDGTTTGAYAIWAALFPGFVLLITDFQNMSYSVAIVGGIVDSLTLALLTGGYIPLRPEGVEITEYLVPVDSNPAFAWDVETAYMQGWNQGSWLREIAPT